MKNILSSLNNYFQTGRVNPFTFYTSLTGAVAFFLIGLANFINYNYYSNTPDASLNGFVCFFASFAGTITLIVIANKNYFMPLPDSSKEE
jgi:hypothetical protein